MSHKEFKLGIIDKAEWMMENRDDPMTDGEPKEYCENCRYFGYSEVDDEYVCYNPASEYCAEQMYDYDYCDEWEKKHE